MDTFILILTFMSMIATAASYIVDPNLWKDYKPLIDYESYSGDTQG